MATFNTRRGRMAQVMITVASVSALVLTVSVGSALAWARPSLAPQCASDEAHYSWILNLSREPDYKIQFSWNSNFSNYWNVNFGKSGEHAFETSRGGSTLYARWKNDKRKSTSALADAQLCVQPSQSESPSATPSESPSATPTESPSATPERVSFGNPERVAQRNPDRVSFGNPDRVSFGNPDRVSFGNPDRVSFGNADRVASAQPRPSLLRQPRPSRRARASLLRSLLRKPRASPRASRPASRPARANLRRRPPRSRQRRRLARVSFRAIPPRRFRSCPTRRPDRR